jgi:hypothetical protein
MRVGWPEGQSVACRTMRVGVSCGSVVVSTDKRWFAFVLLAWALVCCNRL